MAKYYIDTEFLEGTQKEKFPISLFKKETKPTIDLISIGIVSDDNREYYVISKDFNLKEAWNRYDLKINKHYPMGPWGVKTYWIRYNVLKPIFDELSARSMEDIQFARKYFNSFGNKFSYKQLKLLINFYGKTNKEIAEDVRRFIYNPESVRVLGTEDKINFYTYYGAYDHVVFCWLFGKMIDLPEGFPMYSKDLKQELDRIQEFRIDRYKAGDLKTFLSYPKQKDEHNALADAKWNKKLHEFLNKI